MAGAEKETRQSGSPSRTSPPPQRLGRGWWGTLTGILLWGLAVQVLILADAWRHNPFAVTPVVDAEEFWNWAGEIAAGRLIGTTPFMSAPLYPYLLGLVRALGGGLLTVYVLQAGLHLATVGLLAYIAARRFGAVVGLLSAVLYVLLQEPAFFAGRVLNCTLQLFLVVLLWWALVRAQQRLTPGTWAAAGILLGLNCLANPPMLLALPLLSLWAGWQRTWSWCGLTAPAVLIGATFLAISPATLHNYKASREFIPLSVHGGLTFAQGNAPGATGTYTPLPGISVTRQEANLDALRIYEQATGQVARWSAVNSFFFQRGFDYWRSNPGAAATLFFRRFCYFLAGRNVGDIYCPPLEIQEGLSRWLRAAPLPLPWLTLPGLLALAALARTPRRYGPELILTLVPLVVVVLFMFTPRYRLPAAPILVVTCAWAVCRSLQRPVRPAWSIATGLALAGSIALGFVNLAVGFDQPGPGYRADFYQGLGNALVRTGRPADAVAPFQKALALKPDYAGAARNLSTLLKQLGHPEAALPYLQTVARIEPNDAAVQGELGVALLMHRRIDEALPHLRAVVELDPASVDGHNNLANALLLKDDLDGAAQHWQAALNLDPNFAIAHFNLGIVARQRGDDDAALDHFRAALRCNPSLAPAHARIADILLARQDTQGAIAAMKRAHELAPDDPEITAELARLATTTTAPAP